MDTFASSLTRAIGQQYDLFQTSLESVGKSQKFLNYGYTLSRGESYEERQKRLCLEVFRAANIGKDDVLIDVGFGSGEQDFLLSEEFEFRQLTGFNISERQVQYASQRAVDENLSHRLSFRHGEAEALPGVAASSVDKIMAVECAFYFDRPRFYKRAAEVLKPAGLLVLADISLSGTISFLSRRSEDLRRVGTRSVNRTEWEQYFHTQMHKSINRWTRPGAQMTVFEIFKTVPFSRMSRSERREWFKMAYSSQLVAWGLLTRLIHYDLIVLEKK